MSVSCKVKVKGKMSSATNPSSKNPKNVYHIGGLQVEFPYQPYGSQFAFMGRVISTLDRAHREGHCHALLESPTGTGKSLSLLCSSLAWQHRYKSKHHHPKPPPPPEAPADPLAHGGGFVPDDDDVVSSRNYLIAIRFHFIWFWFCLSSTNLSSFQHPIIRSWQKPNPTTRSRRKRQHLLYIMPRMFYTFQLSTSFCFLIISYQWKKKSGIFMI